jgi:LysM repeat protein
VRIYTAPAAFLLAVTAAVLGIHYGLQQHTPRGVPTSARVVVHRPPAKKHPVRRFYIVQRGDSFSVIAAKTRTTVAYLERLNPGASSSALRVGQRIRVK